MQHRRTIFALASGNPPAALAVLRLSGPDTAAIIEKLSGSLSPPRQAVLRAWRDPKDGTIIDRGLQLWFPSPASFTGEDMAELHLHGSAAVHQAMTNILVKEGLQQALSGEFTRRAFDAGKIDPTRIEALADLIAARTEQQRRQALRQMEGALHDLYMRWRRAIIDLRAHVEAHIDFPEDVAPPRNVAPQNTPENVPKKNIAPKMSPPETPPPRNVAPRNTHNENALKNLTEELDGNLAGELDGNLAGELDGKLSGLVKEMNHHVQNRRRGEIVRNGLRVVLAGGVNAGKSSLFNRLIERPAAIVSKEAGTTRDVLEASIDIGGHTVLLTDTAGLRSGGGTIEREGIRRAEKSLQQADLVILLFAPDSPFPTNIMDRVIPKDVPVLPLLHKSDLPSNEARQQKIMAMAKRRKWINPLSVSSTKNKGMDALSNWIERQSSQYLDTGEVPPPTRQRHHALVRECQDHLHAAMHTKEEELIAEELRAASDCLGRIVGVIDVEDVLDSLFHGLCIGK